jgi:hypothetical protein
MNRFEKISLLSAFSVLFTLTIAICQDQKPLPIDNFYSKSLHYTNNGIAYVYSKENGGLERLTGMSGEELGCLKAKCHATSCDACHAKQVDGKPAYSLDSEIALKACHQCHGELEKDNPDVHFAKGMKCMDCHTSREIHGDGVEHNSYNEPGFFDTKCENCHSNISQNASHTAHSGKLDCAVCHTAQSVTCLNCHIEARLAAKKDVQIPVENMYFLVNHNGKVKLANVLTYVYKNKTMITIAPTFGHTITKKAKKCEECHATKIVQDIKKNKFKMARWEKGKLKNTEGVIPVLDGMKWDLVFLDRIDTSWVPLENPVEPLMNYSGYCMPITQVQFGKLTIEQKMR